MKILLFNYEYPPLGGGAGNSTMNVAKALSKLGNDTMVVTTWYPGLAEDEENALLKIVRVKSRRKRKDRSNPIEMLDYVQKTKNISDKIRRFDADFSIAFMSLPSGLSSHYYCQHFNIPYVVSVQGGDVPGFLPNIKSLRLLQNLSFFLTKKVWRQAICVVANSKGLMDLAKITGDRIGARLDFFPNGVDLDFFHPRDNARGESGAVKILFVGRFYKQKGLDYLIEAVAKLSPKYSVEQMQLELVGDGPEKENVVSLIKKYNLDKYISLTSWCNKDELLKKYQDADVFVLSSVEEGMPNVISEAMACGLPVVSTRVRGSEELVQDRVNGILVESKNVEALSESLDKLIGDKSLREKYGQGSLELIKKYSWENVAEYYIDLYKKYLNNNNGKN